MKSLFVAASIAAASAISPAMAYTAVGPDVPIPTVWATCTTFQLQHDSSHTIYALDPANYSGGTSSPQYQEAATLLNVAIAGKRSISGSTDGTPVSGCTNSYRFFYLTLSP